MSSTAFLALSFLITPEQRATTLLNGVYRVAIENTDVSASRRVRFVFKHLVGRKPPSPEPDFRNWFVEIT